MYKCKICKEYYLRDEVLLLDEIEDPISMFDDEIIEPTTIICNTCYDNMED